jgi:hypothetical protein
MAYQDVANLGLDPDFRLRLMACLTTESVLKVGDALADLCLRTPASGADMFMPYVSSAPGFGDKYAAGGQESITDGEILAAVQASWPKVAALYADLLNPEEAVVAEGTGP